MSAKSNRSYFTFQGGRCTLDLTSYTVPEVRNSSTRWLELDFSVSRLRTKPGVAWATVLRGGSGSYTNPTTFEKLYDKGHRQSVVLERFISNAASYVDGMLSGALGSLNNPPLAGEAAMQMSRCIVAFAEAAARLRHDRVVVCAKMTIWYQRHPADREQGFDLNISLD